jgi:translocation and assembly module TamB
VRRVATYGLIILLAALIGAGGWGASWLVGTTEGARWVMDAVSHHTPLTISARRVEGRLLDRLRLEGLRVAQAPFVVEIEGLDYRLQPRLLLSGRVAVRELTLDGVRIQDNTPADIAPDLAWPRVSGVAGFFDGGIERLQVNRLTYRLRDRQSVSVTAISSSVSWRNALLSLSDLAAMSPDGRVAGSITAGFDRPTLQVGLTATPAKPFAGMDAFSLQGRFLSGLGPEQLAGGFTVAGSKGKVNFLMLAGEAGMTRNAFNFRKLRLTGPGRRGSVTGGGTISPTAQAPHLSLQLTVDGLDLSPELNTPTNLFGTLALAGTPGLYRGEFKLDNRGKGWQALHLSGSCQGSVKGMKLAPLTGSLLAGSLLANLDLDWAQEVSLKGTVRGRNLNPAGIFPEWAGVVNFDLAGGIAWPGQAPPRGEVSGRLLESRLHGQALTGEVRADFARGDLRLDRLALRGKGFDIGAAGILDKRLAFNARIGDLGRLIPRTAGEIRADGWVRWRDGRLDGAITGRGGNIAAGGLRIAAADLTARLGEEKGYPLHVAAKLHKASYDLFQVDSVTVEADGTILRHTVHTALSSAGAEARIVLAGAYERGSWRGEINRFSGRDGTGPWSLEAPAPLSVTDGRVVLAPLVLAGMPPERIEIAGELNAKPPGGSVRAAWVGLNMARANPWLSRDLHLDGRLAGRVAGEILPGERLDLTGQASLVQAKIRWHGGNDDLDADLPTVDLSWRWQGSLPASAAEIGAGRLAIAGRSAVSGSWSSNGHRISVERGSLRLDGDDRGLHAGLEFRLGDGGIVKGTFSSPAPARLAVPETGDVTAEWMGIDLALIRPWLPRTINPEGRLAGRTTGNLLPGRKLSLKGDTALSGGKISLLRPEGEIHLNLRTASASWDWQGEALRGAVALALAEQGEARGSFQLPIPARLPTTFDRKGPLLASLTGQVAEKGILSSLFPGFIRESRGELDADLRIDGTWQEPRIKGELKLAKAGAYLPTAGIHVSDIRLAMQLGRDFLRIDSFHAVSGPGHIEGTALVRIKGWQVSGYSGSINGDRFQFVYLPELQILGSPRLTFEGTAEKLAVRGEMRLPELLISGPPTRAVVLPSRDVILEGAPKRAEKSSLLALDVQVRFILGERVLAKVEGIDAQLDGGIDLMFQSLDKINSKGEIRVVKGRYRAYGVDLEIVRGRLFYAGGPVNQPTLDILALRTIGDVRAGVMAGGILRAPVIKLSSEPAMPDVDILSYIVFGHPLGNSSNSEQAGMMAQVAGVLLSKGQSVVLQEQIKHRLGLSTLELQSGSAEAAARMGYKEIQVAPAAVASVKQAAGVSQTMLTVGKYLTPQLYFSYGRGLFTGGNLFRLRYDLFKRWQVETQTGSESGVDLYYKIDFD